MMKKYISIFSLLVLVTFCAAAQSVKPKTEKIPVESRQNAFLHLTELYKTDNWAEYYCTYEEAKKTFNEDIAEKIMYEFFSNYKRKNGYSSVEVEDVKGLTIGSKTTTIEKRIVFRHVNKRR